MSECLHLRITGKWKVSLVHAAAPGAGSFVYRCDDCGEPWNRLVVETEAAPASVCPDCKGTCRQTCTLCGGDWGDGRMRCKNCDHGFVNCRSCKQQRATGLLELERAALEACLEEHLAKGSHATLSVIAGTETADNQYTGLRNELLRRKDAALDRLQACRVWKGRNG
jgi:hypothetical protein